MQWNKLRHQEVAVFASSRRRRRRKRWLSLPASEGGGISLKFKTKFCGVPATIPS